ncbi:UrcA family protein [Brevundimonas sp.]|uniref:UrcA family protein n=1 Tax=Brevundimonas sp. TaxID=1871086 RepID=UPI002C9B8848|nr:UrcA family protein [Brevundimonas sp.]HWQ86024.1 UrcA family protein [Brevundimonas sp.]
MKTLASLAAVLAFASAGSASAQDVRIAWRDLDLSSPAGAAAFDARVEAAARSMCRGIRTGSRISDRASCRAAVQAEALRLLPEQVRADYARSRPPIVT